MKKEKKEELSFFLEKIGINDSTVLEKIVSLTKKRKNLYFKGNRYDSQ